MRKSKQVKFVQGTDLDDLQSKINECLAKGEELCGIDFATLTGAIIYTDYIEDTKKTALDLLEDEFGCHNCAECPFFTEPTDRRKKWTVCEKGRRTRKDSNCCPAYYQIRKEVKSEVSEDQGENDRVRCESRGCGSMAQGLASSGLRPIKWSEQIPTLGVRIPFGLPAHPDGGIIQGGKRCLMR